MKKEIFSLLENYMLSCMGDSAHDAEHVYRVLNNALVIAKDETGVDYDILIAACLLHDIARPEQIADPSLCHAAVGSEKAYRFLVENGFDTAFAAQVRGCIRAHRFRKNDQPETLEGKILFDADKLDVVGTIGIARTLVYKGTVSDPLYTRNPDGSISDGTEGEVSSFFREYKFKLEKLYDRFYTQTGRELALQRKSAAETFYKNLFHEVNTFDQSGKELLFGHII
ncbi:MAG: HD domain-containing protein [Oscillospiraceae bacterium]|nr:HD domain-containing protein [Oscillospiraceae bacterium]